MMENPKTPKFSAILSNTQALEDGLLQLFEKNYPESGDTKSQVEYIELAKDILSEAFLKDCLASLNINLSKDDFPAYVKPIFYPIELIRLRKKTISEVQRNYPKDGTQVDKSRYVTYASQHLSKPVHAEAMKQMKDLLSGWEKTSRKFDVVAQPEIPIVASGIRAAVIKGYPFSKSQEEQQDYFLFLKKHVLSDRFFNSLIVDADKISFDLKKQVAKTEAMAALEKEVVAEILSHYPKEGNLVTRAHYLSTISSFLSKYFPDQVLNQMPEEVERNKKEYQEIRETDHDTFRMLMSLEGTWCVPKKRDWPRRKGTH